MSRKNETQFPIMAENAFTPYISLLQSEDLIHRQDPSGPVLQAAQMHYQIQRRGDLAAYRRKRQLAAHQGHRLQPAEHIGRAVRVPGG